MAPYGLQNYGNTCCYNTLLQCILHVDCVKKYFREVTPKEDGDFVGITKELFVHENPNGRQLQVWLRHLLHKCGFRGGEEQDMDEVIHLVFDKMGDCAPKPRRQLQDSENNEFLQKCADFRAKHVTTSFQSLVYGVRVDQTRCHNCKRCEQTLDVYCVLHVPLSPRRGIQTLVNNIFAETFIDGNRPCDRCKKTKGPTSIVTRLYIPPPCLIILVKRFQLNEADGFFYKDESRVDSIDLCLDMQPHVLWADHDQCQMQRHRHVYALSAIACHTGDLDNGHYYAIVRSSDKKEGICDSGSDSEWYVANDTEVFSIDRSELQSNKVRSDVYALFYERISSS